MPFNNRERILNVLPSKDTATDWTLESAVDAGVLAAAALPAKVDLREDWWEIGNQEQTGSCVGWACADGVLRWHLVQAGKLQPGEHLSVRQVWMASKETDEIDVPASFLEAYGTTLKGALKVVRDYGVVPDSVLPFDSPQFFTGDPNAFYTLAAQRRIASYHTLGAAGRNWREWLANSGPILTRLDCDDAWFDAKQTDGELTDYVLPPRPAGHAVSIVGYTADHFIVRNSWGTEDWGDKGFAYASNAYAAAAFTEAYGVLL
jgi:Papain family cysteine protease